MSNIKARSGIQQLLSKFDDTDLFSLAATVTQGLLRNKVNSRNEAINAVINYSSDELSILRRKIVTRDVLFSYLHDNNIPVNIPITKNELIDKILEFWNVQTDPAATEQRYKSINHIQEGSNSSSDVIRNSEQINATVVTYEKKPEDNNISLLAEQFVKWFYPMLNQNECIDSEHFYPDAKMKINLICNDQCDSQVVENSPEEISRTLLQTKLQHNLYFNPNISKDGVQGRMDPHGLVMVLACGTLHVNNVCAGVFEQVFALARDPFCDNNWKVKNTEMNLRSKNSVMAPPNLCDSELTSNLLMLPSN